MMIEVPRGLEILVKKAAVDAAFRECLLRERDAAADRIGLVLEPAEAALLRAIPAAQLEAVVANTAVPPRFRAAFMGYAAAAMLVCASMGKTANDDKAPFDNGTTLTPPMIPDAAYHSAITGTIMDIHMSPLKDLAVEIEGTSLSAVSNDYGWFIITDVPTGDYTVTLVSAGFYRFAVSGVKVRRDLLASCHLYGVKIPTSSAPANTLVNNGALCGHVSDAHGRPFGSGKVHLVNTELCGEVIPGGFYEITGIPPGYYELQFDGVSDDPGAYIKNVNVEPGALTLAHFSLTTAIEPSYKYTGISPK